MASAADISPSCPGVIDALVDNGRIELLTPYAEAIDPESLDESTTREVIEQLIDTLAVFEQHAFVATDVRLGAIAVDERGRIVLLPGTYALAPGLGDETTLPAVARVMGEILEHVGTTAGPFAERLARTAGEIASGRMGTIAELSVALFDRPPAGGREWPGSETGANAMSGRVSEVNNLLAGHSLVIIEGGDESGKSAILHGLYQALRNAGKPVRRIDEWSLSSRPRRKGGPEKNIRTDVWLVDDVGEKPTLYAPLFDHIALSGEETRVVWSLSTQTPPACEVFLQGIRARAHAAATVRLERSEESRGRVENALAAFSSHETPPESGTFDDLLTALTAEERRILELAAVARIPLPLSFLSTVFAETEGGVRPHLHRLSAARLLEIDYRALPPSGSVSATIAIAGASLRRVLYEQIPESRRRVLHRTIARLADSQGGFPPMEIYRHLMLGREYTAAGTCAVAFLASASREERAPFLEQLTRELVDTKRYETLDYENQLRLLVSIGSDLCERGKQHEAERLLVLTRDVEGDPDEVRVHAALVSEAMRLLADTWTVRSNYTQALDLLHDTREELNPYLSLAQQARLMNEIGWLQYRLGDYDTAVESCKLSLNTLNSNEHPLVVAQALNLMGVIHYNTSRYDEAISYYEQSAILREKEGDRNALAGSFNNLALAYQSKGEYDKALDRYEKSLTIKKEQNNEAGIAAGYLNQALLFLEVHNFDEAERKCQDSLALASDLAIAQLIAKNNSTLGDIALTRERFDDAEQYYRESLALARSIETTNEEMGALRRLAQLYLTRERLAEAREAVEEAARLAQGLGSKYESARIDEILGDINRAEGVEVGDKLDHVGRNYWMMPGERSGQDDVTSLQLAATFDQVL
ncbi:MAG: tetratricopeptide repeat protein [Candidatus Krumholzibacteriota bacterium]|nr:tetratricopeptide repeat protein [Candidatus Krumholzibacteriota bacterium]